MSYTITYNVCIHNNNSNNVAFGSHEAEERQDWVSGD